MKNQENLRNFRRMLMIPGAFACALLMTACMDNTAMDMATQTPQATQNMTNAPVITTAPTQTNPMQDMNPSAAPAAAGVTSMSDAMKMAEKIEEELERLSEVDDAQVALAGTTAVVALEFDDQYQSGLDQRLKDIVSERVKGVVKDIEDVIITEEPELFTRIEDLGDKLDANGAMDDLKTELDAIIQKIKGAMA